MRNTIAIILSILLPLICTAQQNNAIPPGVVRLQTTCPMYIYSVASLREKFRIDSIPTGTYCYTSCYKLADYPGSYKHLWHVYYNKKTGFLLDSVLTYANLNKRTPLLFDDSGTMEKIAKFFENITDSTEKPPTSIWEATFGSGANETVQSIKNQTYMVSAHAEAYGKVSTITYEHCLWDGQYYTSIQLRFYDGKLCGGLIEAANGLLSYESITASMQRIYGVCHSIYEARAIWKFANATNIIVDNDPAHKKVTVNIYQEPAIISYLNEVKKQLTEDSTRIAEEEAKQAAKDEQLQSELPGFWSVKFGQDPETVIKTIKANKKYTPVKRKTEGKAVSVYYGACIFGSDKCTEALLTFYNNKLCGGYFTISCDASRTKEIVKDLRDKYGTPKTTSATSSIWDFKDGNGIFTHQMDSESAEILYTRNKEFEQFSTETNKKRTSDY